MGIEESRYASGYTHKTELDQAIPMHFYEREGVTASFDILGGGYTSTVATQGQIPIDAPEYDPASIFYIFNNDDETTDGSNVSMSTQELYVKGEIGKQESDGDGKGEGDGVRAKAYMTATEGEASALWIMDIGGGVMLIHDRSIPKYRKYLSYDQTDANHIYDLKLTHNTHTDHAKWCLEPANNKGLWIKTNSGGEEEVLTDLWYYSSYCVPFDLLIQKKTEDDGDGVGIHSSNAYTCVAEWNSKPESPWSEEGLHPRPIGKYNTGTYANNDYFVPAGTPVLFSTKRATQYIKATIPTTTPSTSISTIFSYEYLEQKISDTYDDDRRVYVFGPKMEGNFTLNTSTGDITAVLPSLGNTNVGFHINANLNKESGMTTASWTRHNYYVLHNKIYYRAPEDPSSAPSIRDDVQFVPVVFGDEDVEENEGEEEVQPEGGERKRVEDGQKFIWNGQLYILRGGVVYDALGRKVGKPRI